MGGRDFVFGARLRVLGVAALLLLHGATPATTRAQDGGWELIAGAPGCQRVALIFNIGMGNEARMGVLDNLAANGVPATVFPMGSWTWQNPDLVWRMANQGFVVGSHGDQAIPLTQRGDWAIAQDVRDSFWAIESALGYPPAPYFTPFAADRDARVNAIVAGEGYVPVGWEVTSADWMAEASADSVYGNVMSGVYDGAIVEFHLDAPNTAGSTEIALPWIVADLAAQGYTFVTVPEMASPC